MNKGLEKVIIKTATPAENLAALYFLSAKTGLPVCDEAERLAINGKMIYPYISGNKNADFVIGMKDFHHKVEDNPNHIINFDDLHKFDDFVKKLDNTEALVILNKEYTAVVTATDIKVGCQTFPISIIKDLQAALDKVNS